MSQLQRVYSAKIALILVYCWAGTIIAFLVSALAGDLTLDGIVGPVFLTAAQETKKFMAVLATASLVITTGLGVGAKLPKGGNYMKLALLGLGTGLACAIFLLYLLCMNRAFSGETALSSGLDVDPTQFRSLALPFILSIIAALATSLAILLGIRPSSPTIAGARV